MAKITNIRIGIDARGAQTGAAQASRSFDDIGRAAARASKQVDELEKEVDDLGSEAKDTRKEADDLATATDDLGEASSGAAGMVGKLVGAISAMLIVNDIISTMREFESGLVGVGKTTDLAGAQLEQMGADIVQMSTDLGVSTDELLGIAQAAGQLGVSGSSNVLAFTDAVAKLSSASDLVGDDAATALARMLNVTGESVGTVGTLSSVIVELGNNMAITESQIAHVGTQVALSTAVFGTSSAEAAALGAAMGQMGIRAELAGSALGRTMRSIDKAIRQGGVEMEALQAITGKTAEEIESAFRDSAVGGVQLLLEGLGELDAVGGDTTAALEALGLEGEEILKVLPVMALRSQDVADALAMQAAEVENATAADEEFARAQDTLAMQTQRMWNAFDALKLQVKETGGVLKNAASFTADLIAHFSGLTVSGKHSETMLRAVGAALTVMAVPATVIAVEALVSGLYRLATSAKVAAAAQWALNSALLANPFVAVAALIAAVGGAIWAMTRDVEEATTSTAELDNVLQGLEATAARITRAEAAFSIGYDEGDSRRQLGALRAAITALQDMQVEIRELGTQAPDVGMWEFWKDLPSVFEQAEDGTRELIAGLDLSDLRTAVSEMLLEGIEVPESVFIDEAGKIRGLSEDYFKLIKADIERNAEGLGDVDFTLDLFGRNLQRGVSPVIDELSPEGQIKAISAALRALEAQMKPLTEAYEPPDFAGMTGGVDEDADALARAEEALEKYQEDLDFTQKHIKATSDELRALNEVRKMEQLVDSAKVENSKELKAELKEQIETINKQTAAIKEQAARDKVLTGHAEKMQSLAKLNDLMKDGQVNMAIETALLRAEAEMRAVGVVNVELYVKALREELELRERLTKQQQEQRQEEARLKAEEEQRAQVRDRAAAGAAQLLNNSMLELDTLGLTNMERERASRLMEYAVQLHQAEAENIGEKLAVYEQLLMRMQEAEIYQEMAEEMGAAFGSAFNDVILGARTMEEALQGIAESVGRTVLDTLVTTPLTDWITGQLAELLPTLFGDAAIETTGAEMAAAIQEAAAISASATIVGGAETAGAVLLANAQAAAAVLAAASVAGGFAKGAAFSGGEVVPMASGSVVTGRTYFPMAGNKVGLMGEAGPEAVMPLTRTASGDLGVRVEGSTAPTNVTNISMNVTATDADSFRRSRHQISRDLRRIR